VTFNPRPWHTDQMARYLPPVDCVIVGAGGGGLRAALESSKRASTAVVTKLYPTRAHRCRRRDVAPSPTSRGLLGVDTFDT